MGVPSPGVPHRSSQRGGAQTWGCPTGSLQMRGDQVGVSKGEVPSLEHPNRCVQLGVPNGGPQPQGAPWGCPAWGFPIGVTN